MVDGVTINKTLDRYVFEEENYVDIVGMTFKIYFV